MIPDTYVRVSKLVLYKYVTVIYDADTNKFIEKKLSKCNIAFLVSDEKLSQYNTVIVNLISTLNDNFCIASRNKLMQRVALAIILSL